jgi:CRISPR-associated protein Csb1
LKRSAQYFPPIDYVSEGLFDDELLETTFEKNKKVGSVFGLKAAPAPVTHGGVIVRGEIRREAILRLVSLRSLGPAGEKGDGLRRYILALALLAMTYDGEHNLRQGCLLVGDPEKPALWEVVMRDGTRTPVAPDREALVAFAQAAEKTFGKGKDQKVAFDRKAANDAIAEKIGGKTARGKRGKKDE